MAILESVKRKLSDDLWKRPRESDVDKALATFDLDPTSEFAEFFKTYWGPFSSHAVGYELLDLVEQEESVVSNTETVRKEFGFPNRFIVVSPLTGLSVLVYDTESGNVFDVDFEGGDELLLEGKLSPRWNTWNDFISDYFGD